MRFWLALILVVFCSTAFASNGIYPDRYLDDENGTVDLELLRKAGFEGPLETGDRLLRFDPESGAPILVPGQGDKTNSDEPWAEGFGLPGFDGTVNAICVYNGEIMVGGQFRTFGSVDCDNLAVYDGTRWWGFEEKYGHTMAKVNCMTVHEGRLVIAGDVGVEGSSEYCRHIVGFDGSDLHPYNNGFSGEPEALLNLNGTLIAGGNFWYNGNNTITLKHLARWNGYSWSSYGGGMNSQVQALCEHDGELVVAGRFSEANGLYVNGIARWTGGHFATFTSGFASAYNNIKALLSHDGVLYAGGDFSSVEGVAADNLISWDGTAWQQVGGGIDDQGYVDSLTNMDGQILVGGKFSQAGSVTTRGCALWNGTNYVPMGEGVYKDSFDGGVTDAIIWEDKWWLVGWFNYSGDLVANHIACWDGAEWHNAPQTEGAGVSGTTYSLCLWNGDLVASGSFQAAGSTRANHIARWDGNTWHALGEGLDEHAVSLAVWNGDLYASGDFEASGELALNHLARWDGASWHDVGGGLDREADVLLARPDGLLAGGFFTSAGGVPAAYLAQWDGAAWNEVGGGLDDRVRCLMEYDGHLYAGGDFQNAGGNTASHLARWDGANWSEFAGGADGDVHALAFYGGVVAGGEFMELGGVPCSRVGRWDGTAWHQLGAGFVDEICVEFEPGHWDCWNVYVTDMVVNEGRLFVNGITQSGSLPLVNLACWTDEEHWTPLGSGRGGARALCADEQSLWVGGGFTPLMGSHNYCLTRWDIDRIPMGGDELWWAGFDNQSLDNHVFSMCQYDGNLLAAGYFTSAGGQPAPGIASWNGTDWTPFEAGFGTFGMNRPQINALVEWEGDLYAAGMFSLPPSEDFVSLARWDGSVWQPLMEGIFAQSVSELIPFGDELMLVGNFEAVNGAPATGLAAFDGQDFTVIPAYVSHEGFSAYKLCAAVYDGCLVIGGNFEFIQGQPSENLARWNGTNWLPDTDGFQASYMVRDLCVFQGDLYVGGPISDANGLPVGGVARWDGSQWDNLNGGLGRDGSYNAYIDRFGVVGDKLAMAGCFNSAEGQPVSESVVMYDGSQWHSLGSGFLLNYGTTVRAITEWDGDLYLGGNFSIAGDKNSAYIARWMMDDLSHSIQPVTFSTARLDAIYPNPFNPSTTVRFTVHRSTDVKLAVYDLRGRLMQTLLSGPVEAGPQTLVWDGCDVTGNSVASGVYFVKLKAGEQQDSRKILLLK